MEVKQELRLRNLRGLGVSFSENQGLVCYLKSFDFKNRKELYAALCSLLSNPRGEEEKFYAEIKGVQKIATFLSLLQHYESDDDIQYNLDLVLKSIKLPERHIIFEDVTLNPKRLSSLHPKDIRFTYKGKKYILLRQKNAFENRRKITELDPAISMCLYLFLQDHVCLDIAVYDEQGLRRGVAAEEVTDGVTISDLMTEGEMPPWEEFSIKIWARFFAANYIFEESDGHEGNVLVSFAVGPESNQPKIIKVDHERCLLSKTSKYSGYLPGKIKMDKDGFYPAPEQSFAKITPYDIDHLPFVEDVFLMDGLVNGRYAQYLGRDLNDYFHGIEKNRKFIAEKYKCFLLSLLLPAETFVNIFQKNVVSKKSVESCSNYIVDRINKIKACLMTMPDFWHHVIDHPEWSQEIIAELLAVNKEFPGLVDVAKVKLLYNGVYQEVSRHWMDHARDELNFPTKKLPPNKVIEKRADNILEFFKANPSRSAENISKKCKEVKPLILKHKKNLKGIKGILDIQKKVEGLCNYFKAKKRGNFYEKSHELFKEIEKYLLLMENSPDYYKNLKSQYDLFKSSFLALLNEVTKTLAGNVFADDWCLIKMKIDLGLLSGVDIWRDDNNEDCSLVEYALRLGRTQIVKLFFDLDKNFKKEEPKTELEKLIAGVKNAAIDYCLQYFAEKTSHSFFFKPHNISRRSKDIYRLFKILKEKDTDIASLKSQITAWADPLKSWRGRSVLCDRILQVMGVSDSTTAEVAAATTLPSSSLNNTSV